MSKIIRSSKKVELARLSEIKHEAGGPVSFTSGSATAGSEGEMRARADAHVLKLLEDAREQAKEIHELAFAEGYQGGIESGQEEIRGKVQSLEELILRAQDEKRKALKDAEAEIAGLATRIAEKILNEQIKISPEVVVAIAKRAIELAIDREHIVIRINPADREMMRRHKAEMFASADGVKSIQVVADQAIKQGGCVIETNSGNVDAQLASQLAQVEECLLGAIDGGEQQPN